MYVIVIVTFERDSRLHFTVFEKHINFKYLRKSYVESFLSNITTMCIVVQFLASFNIIRK